MALSTFRVAILLGCIVSAESARATCQGPGNNNGDVNPGNLCPQSQCYGESGCCFATQQCLAANANNCQKANVGETLEDFPPAGPDNRVRHGDGEFEVDGCRCAVPESSPCITQNLGNGQVCWGELYCDTSLGRSCASDGICLGDRGGQGIANDGVAPVGDFCWMGDDASEDTLFQFCPREVPTTTLSTTTTTVSTTTLSTTTLSTTTVSTTTLSTTSITESTTSTTVSTTTLSTTTLSTTSITESTTSTTVSTTTLSTTSNTESTTSQSTTSTTVSTTSNTESTTSQSATSTTITESTTSSSLTTTSSSVSTTSSTLSTTSSTLSTTTTTKGADLVCDLNCYTPAADPVHLDGSQGAGSTAFVPDVSQEECVALCQANEECEAVVYDVVAQRCYGRKDLTFASDCGCLYHPGFLTLTMDGRDPPWGKCTVFGDPHISTFDSMTMAGGSKGFGDLINIYEAGVFGLVTSDSITIQGRFGYTQEYTQASSLIGLAMSGPLTEGNTLSVGYVGPCSSPYYAGWAMYYGSTRILITPGSWTSMDGLVSVTLGAFNPTDYCADCRAPITREHKPYSYLIQLGSPYNVQVYLLPGQNIGNAVVKMRRVVGQEGVCGTFDCDKSDDTSEAIKENPNYPFTDGTDLFPEVLEPPAGWDQERGPSRKEAMEACPWLVKAQCGLEDSKKKARWNACVFDACMAHADKNLKTTELMDADAMDMAWTGSLRGSKAWTAPTATLAVVGAFAAVGFALFSRRYLGGFQRLATADVQEEPEMLERQALVE